MAFGLGWVRHRQRALARGVLALFVLAWLQAAALPCVMAHAASDARPMTEHCPYCPPADGADGCDDQGACVFPHDPQVDARVVATMFVAVGASIVLPVAAANSAPGIASDAALTEPIPRIPIPVSYCRFIE